jgi:ferrochelatase
MTPPTPQVGVLLLQLGGPKTLDAIQPFLTNLFEDVLPLPRFLRRPLAKFIAWRRTPEVKPLYQEIGGGSPLLQNTQDQRDALQQALRRRGVDATVGIAMRYAPPRVEEGLEALHSLPEDVPRIALSLYPHYSFATSRSSLRELQAVLGGKFGAAWRSVCAYPTDPAYLDGLAQQIRRTLEGLPAPVQAQAHLVFSAHGLPMSLIREGDPYPEQIKASVQGIMQRLELPPERHTLCYQSRVGPVKWLEPDTVTTMKTLGESGKAHLVIVPIAFTSEHIETLHEMDIQLQQTARDAGVQTYARVPTAGVDPAFIEALAGRVVERMAQPKVCCGVFAGCELRQV